MIVVKSLAQLLHGVALSTSIMCGQGACRDVTLTPAPVQAHALDSSHRVTCKYKFQI